MVAQFSPNREGQIAQNILTCKISLLLEIMVNTKLLKPILFSLPHKYTWDNPLYILFSP